MLDIATPKSNGKWTLQDFYQEAGAAVLAMEAILTPHLREVLFVDHISFKCGSRELFERMRGLFEASGDNFWNAYVSGRSIGYVFLNKPIEMSIGKIRFLELADQKPDGSQVDGFDHIEVYLLNNLLYTQTTVVGMLDGLGFGKVKHSPRPHHPTYDLIIGDSGFECKFLAFECSLFV